MLKVLHVYKSYFPDTCGGVEQFIRTLTMATSKLGVQNTLLTTSSLPSSTVLALKIKRAPANFTIASCPFSTRFYKQFKQLASVHDVIHIHFPWPFGEIISQYLIKSTHKLVITYHADITRQKYYKWLYYPFMHRLMKRANHLVATSTNMLNSSPTLVRYQHKTAVIPLAINLNDYMKPSLALVEKWRQTVGENFILFVGQFRYYKGIEILLQALVGTDIPCVLVGNGPSKPELEKLTQTLGLKQVYFVGPVSEIDKMALFELSRAITLPSTARSEAFGLVLLEGLAFSKPLITTELGTGTSFVNRHNDTGLVIPPNNIMALRESLKMMYVDQIYDKFQQRTFEHFNQFFRLEDVAQQYCDLYSSP